MATSSEAGAAATAYGGGGAGGKFRKKPFRRANLPTTPYDRPLAARISNPDNGSSNNPGLFAKLVVEPASKLISYGAHRLFSAVFSKRLPPPPPQAPEVNCHVSDELQAAVSDDDVLKSGGGTSGQPLCNSGDDGISELEQLLKQKTFSRSEVDHLTGILRSRIAVELSSIVGLKRSEGRAPDFDRHQPFASSPSEEHMQDGDKSRRVMSSPNINSRVIEDDVASPAELAIAYMGSRPYKISPSNLGTLNQVHREDAGLLPIVPFASKSPNISLNMIDSVGLGDPNNDFITPKSRGRSAIYNMARTPYSRVHPLSIKKTLKRRSSVLDDDPRSVGPMRRLRQKPNLLASKIPLIAHGVESGSDLALVSSKQKLPLVVEQKNKVSKIAAQNDDDSIPSTSYACVSSKSTEVAARILQHLEKLTPKEKSSESKLAIVRDKSTFRLTPSMLHGQALRSMEDVDSLKLLLAVPDDRKLEDRSDVALSHGQVSTLEMPGKVENSYKETSIVSDMLNPAVKNEFVKSSTIPGPSRTADSVVKNIVTESPQTKKAFRMSAKEDFLELDDDEHCYRLATRPLAEGRGPPDAHTLGNRCSTYEEPKLVKTTSQTEIKLPVDLSKRTESSNPNAPITETRNDGISISLSERENVDVLSQSVISFEKAYGTNNSVPLFMLGSQTVDNIPPLPSESVGVKPESKSENSTSLLDAVSTPKGSKMEIPESDQGVYLNSLQTRDANEKPHTMPFASDGPLIPKAPTVSFTTTSSHDATQISTAISSPLTCSTSMASSSSIGSSTNTTSLTSIASFGLTGFSNSTASTSDGNSFLSNAAGSVFKFGACVDPSSALPAASTATISEVSDLKSQSEKESNLSSSSVIHPDFTSFAVTNSGNSPLTPSTSSSTSFTSSFQGSLPAIANKSSVSDYGLVSQSRSFPFGSSVSMPSLNMNGSMPLSTSLFHPQFNPNQSLGFSTSASSAETSMVKSGSGPTSSVGGFGMSSTLSGDSVVSLNAPAKPAIFGFGLSSSSTSASAVSLTNGVTPVVNYGGSSVATSVTSNTSSSSMSTSGIFNFSASSSASSSGASNIFGSTWESPKPLGFSSTFTTSSPSSVFAFGMSASTAAPANATSTVFNSQSGPSSSPNFPFSTSSPAFSLPSLPVNQPIFGNRPPSFTASPSDQMTAEDSMAEDPVQSSAPSIFGQPTISPSPPSFMFGSAAPPLSNPFQFSGQQNQIAPLNPSSFQASGSLEFNSGGSFSLGSGGGDKSNRKYVKVNRNKNRKK